jgi:hypothetical protein
MLTSSVFPFSSEGTKGVLYADQAMAKNDCKI